MPSLPQPDFQPFVRLAQSNFASLSEFWLSPDVVQQPLAVAQRLFNPNSGGTANLASTAEPLSRLVRGLTENYSRFFSELTQSGMSLWNQAQAAAGDAADNVVNATEGTSRRSRAAA
ncbi:hypothetical protein [Ideonella sp. BN130291]|uniref:hypothetical protein n=1 Tax=Ideonella sp. BN130291 TaxID=3112940 RepID=UPI002E269925|nr:hypothetical protein [Ideonella sp. BN130291]